MGRKSSAKAKPPMRILFLSNIFPNALNPTGGAFNLSLTTALAQRDEVHVIAPVAWPTAYR